jgi:hypothetical protein
MCGGIVSALSAAAPPKKRFPIPVIAQGVVPASNASADTSLRILSYNIGRIGSYAVAGALAGGLAQGARTFSSLSAFQIGGYWFANLMLIALGLYLMDAWRGLTHLETAGQALWRRIQPLTKPLLPMDSAPKALALGGLWGWIPCGMVYSVLLTAMMTGSAASGAAVMIAFGLGTLPMLLSLGMLGTRIRSWAKHRVIRIACGAIVLTFGVLGLVRAANGLSLGWLDAVCVTPHAEGQP